MPLSAVAPQPAPPPPHPWPARLPLRVWVGTVLTFVASYLFLFTVAHPYVDTRVCVAQLPDPFFALLSFDERWYLVSHQLFYVVTAAAVGGLVYQATRGDHRPFIRFGLGISIQVWFRTVTMALLPLCRVSVAPGTAPLAEMPYADLGFMRIPFRSWATNDLVFSGHVCEFLILTFAVWRSWPRWAIAALVGFQALQAVALIGTRGHYTVDLVVAVPFAVLSDLCSVALVRWTTRASKLASV